VPKLTVTVITCDEAANLDACLASVAWADEIVVVDSGSIDDTVAIARRHSARVEVRPWPGYGAQRNCAASLAAHDWILAIDADERVPPELAREIRAVLTSEPARHGYRIPRVAWYLGRWIRGTDWYPDYQLRLYDRRAGRWNERRVHESLALDDEPGVLGHELRHFAYRDISHHLSTIDRYTTLAAEQWADEGRRVSLASIIVHPPLAFLRNYVLKRGFTQGAPGLLVSVLNSYYVFLKLAKAWELNRAGMRDAERGVPDAGRGTRNAGAGIGNSEREPQESERSGNERRLEALSESSHPATRTPRSEMHSSSHSASRIPDPGTR
jgi:glycosyltransferase involved in cell wall biosynthesis